MNIKKSYAGLDSFRLIAALLVVAIHTSPLLSVSETGDIIVSRIIARVAVPFFFMTSGYFLISRYADQTEKLKWFIKKTVMLYGIAIFLYLPLNVYNDYFKMPFLLPNIIKDLFFDGTMYHLWYLPAAILGAVIAWGLVRKLGFKWAYGISFLLYLIGLFGDSYYNLLTSLLQSLFHSETTAFQLIYQSMFELFDYTRNGLFYAPIFFVMGAGFADAHLKRRFGTSKGEEADTAGAFVSKPVSILLLIIFTTLMLGEGLLLRVASGTPTNPFYTALRHDSMYLFLLPVMFFLFQLLLYGEGRRHTELRNLSLLVYILHPMVIVIVRLFAKLTGLQTLLIENSLIHYLAVCVISAAASWMMVRGYSIFRSKWWCRRDNMEHESGGQDDRKLKYVEQNMTEPYTEQNPERKNGTEQNSERENDTKRKNDIGQNSEWKNDIERNPERKNVIEQNAKGENIIEQNLARDENRAKDRAWIELDRNNLQHNVKELQKLMQPGCKLMAVVKAEAYGHGAYHTAVCLNEMGVRAYAVATLDEGIQLRRYGILGDILVLGYTAPERAKELKRYHIMQTLLDASYARQLNQQRCHVKVHIKVDTGMHRLGCPAEAVDEIAELFSLDYLKVDGIFTHLCDSERQTEEAAAFTKWQVDRFFKLLHALKKREITLPKVHMQSSYGLLNYPELSFDYARIGIALYGVLCKPGDETKCAPSLRPVLSLKARIALVREVKAGESIGYDRAYIAPRDCRIAILSIGYADGVPRELSHKGGRVIINGSFAPIAGNICMDQMAVDVTNIEGVRSGMTATLIGREGNAEITAPEMADEVGSIANELLSRMGRRLRVV